MAREERRESGAAARLKYTAEVREKLSALLCADNIRILTGSQVTVDWDLMRFGRITSTGAVRDLLLLPSNIRLRNEASATENMFLRQNYEN